MQIGDIKNDKAYSEKACARSNGRALASQGAVIAFFARTNVAKRQKSRRFNKPHYKYENIQILSVY